MPDNIWKSGTSQTVLGTQNLERNVPIRKTVPTGVPCENIIAYNKLVECYYIIVWQLIQPAYLQ